MSCLKVPLPLSLAPSGRGIARLLALGVLLLSGCSSDPGPLREHLPESVAEILQQADTLTLLSLNPDGLPSENYQQLPEAERFHGYQATGRTELEEASARAELCRLLAEGMDRHDGSFALCFLPRHGVRARRGEEQVDLLICFECLQLKVVRDGGEPRTEGISDAVEPQFSALYRAAGLSIHP